MNAPTPVSALSAAPGVSAARRQPGRRRLGAAGLLDARQPQQAQSQPVRADLDAVATELGDKPFLLGDKPSSFDAAVFGFTSGIAAFPSDSPIKSHLAALANLAAYNQRMLQRYFPADRPPGGSK